MKWLYLSPHYDDAAFSCGGLIWEQTQTGEDVSIWTICGGDPPSKSHSAFTQSLHTRWKTSADAVAQRRLENLASCVIIGASSRNFHIPDCIYRTRSILRTASSNQTASKKSQDLIQYPPQEITTEETTTTQFLYTTEESLTGPLHPEEHALINELSTYLSEELPQKCTIVCPLAIGGHVDHRLTRASAEKLNRKLCYYIDYPYIFNHWDQLDKLRSSGWEAEILSISDKGIKAWEDSIAAHHSQISTFWSDSTSMKTTLHKFYHKLGGIILMKSPNPSP
jgi:LmbE family N-acetylglucosaminyl deacetylase